MKSHNQKLSPKTKGKQESNRKVSQVKNESDKPKSKSTYLNSAELRKKLEKVQEDIDKLTKESDITKKKSKEHEIIPNRTKKDSKTSKKDSEVNIKDFKRSKNDLYKVSKDSKPPKDDSDRVKKKSYKNKTKSDEIKKYSNRIRKDSEKKNLNIVKKDSKKMNKVSDRTRIDSERVRKDPETNKNDSERLRIYSRVVRKDTETNKKDLDGVKRNSDRLKINSKEVRKDYVTNNNKERVEKYSDRMRIYSKRIPKYSAYIKNNSNRIRKDSERDSEDSERDNEHSERDNEDSERDGEDSERDSEDYERGIEDYKKNGEDYKRNIEDSKIDNDYYERGPVDFEQTRKDASLIKKTKDQYKIKKICNTVNKDEVYSGEVRKEFDKAIRPILPNEQEHRKRIILKPKSLMIKKASLSEHKPKYCKSVSLICPTCQDSYENCSCPPVKSKWIDPEIDQHEHHRLANIPLDSTSMSYTKEQLEEESYNYDVFPFSKHESIIHKQYRQNNISTRPSFEAKPIPSDNCFINESNKDETHPRKVRKDFDKAIRPDLAAEQEHRKRKILKPKSLMEKKECVSEHKPKYCKSVSLICPTCQDSYENCLCPPVKSEWIDPEIDQHHRLTNDSLDSTAMIYTKEHLEEESYNHDIFSYSKHLYPKHESITHEHCRGYTEPSYPSFNAEPIPSDNSSVYLPQVVHDFEENESNFKESFMSDLSEFSMEVDEIESNDESQNESSKVIVVVDTNVLIDDLLVVEELRSVMFYGKTMKIIIPYIVLQELDSLKKKDTKLNSQRAIKWCNSYLENSDLCVQTQDYEEYQRTKAEYGTKQVGDDAILSCCLSLKSIDHTIYLLSNDVNFRNKAIASNLRTFNAKKLKMLMLKKNCFPSKRERDLLVKSQNENQLNFDDCVKTSTPTRRSEKPDPLISKIDIENSITNHLGAVLEYAMKDTYDDLWTKIIIHKPPWSAMQVLKCFEKHWLAVFIEKFSSNVKDKIVEVRESLESNRLKNIDGSLSRLYSSFKNEPYKSMVKVEISESNLEKENYSQLETFNVVDKALKMESCNSERIMESIVEMGKHADFVLNEIDERQCSTMAGMSNQSQELNQSLEMLRSSLISFGNLIVSINEGSIESSGLALSQQLSTFWELAQRNVPPLALDESSVRAFAASRQGKEFLQSCLAGLEQLIQRIDSMRSLEM